MQFEEKSDLSGEVDSYHGNDLEIEVEYKSGIFCEALLMVAGDTKYKLFADEEGIEIGSVACARGESLCNVSPKDIPNSETCDRMEKPLSDGLAPDILGTTTKIKEMEVTTSPPSGSVKLATSAECISCTNNVSKMDSSHSNGKMKSTLQLNKEKTTKHENVQSGTNLSSKKPKGAPLTEKLTKDTAKSRSSSSNNQEDDLYSSEHKEGRSSVGHLSSSTGENFVSSSKSAKSDGYHALPVKSNSIPAVSQSARNGLKNSMLKVVQQFRPSKQSKCNVSNLGSEVAGKHKVILFSKYNVFSCFPSFCCYNFGIDSVCCFVLSANLPI